MHSLCCCMLVASMLATSFHQVQAQVKYTGGTKNNPTFLLSAILPLRKTCNDKAKVNPQGIAIAEALEFAIGSLKTEEVFKNSKAVQGLGFVALDSCNSVDKRRALAYELVRGKKMPDIVLSQFKKEDLQTIKILANEQVPQMSYVADNALLAKDDDVTAEDIKLLVSAFPEESNKMKAVAEMVEKELDFDHVHMIGSNDQHGKVGLKLLEASLGDKTCSDAMFISDKNSIDVALDKIQANPLIRAVVVHVSGSKERELYEAVAKQNLTDLIFISTQDWKTNIPVLKQHAKVTEGLLYVNLDNTLTNAYGIHLKAAKRPFVQKKWLEDLYKEIGGNTNECYKPGTFEENAPKNTKYCNKAEERVRDLLGNERQVARLVIDAVYAIAHALNNKGATQTLLDSLSSVDFENKMTGNMVNYQGRALLSNNYEVHQMQGAGNVTDTKYIGTWKPASEPKLDLNSKDLRFKGGSLVMPLSACSPKCSAGTFRKYSEDGDKCCWDCTPCADGLITNTSNADICLSCQQGFTAFPNQTNCSEYSLVYFHWFSAMGQFMIFLMVCGICLALFALGIVSQNSDHIVVKLGGYKLMSFYLLGCALLAMCPVAILIEPSPTTCSSFIGMFCIGVSIPLAVLISKSAIVTENLYDPEGDLIKYTLGRRPRVVVILIVLCAQVGVVIVSSVLSPPEIKHTDSDRWDWKYAECANTKSASFWAPFFFNFFLGILCNVLSCGAKRINDNFGELRNICCTTLLFFLACLIHAVVIFKLLDMNLMEGQAVLCVIYGLFFLIGFVFPKIHIILFETVNEEDEVEIANAGDNDGD